MVRVFAIILAIVIVLTFCQEADATNPRDPNYLQTNEYLVELIEVNQGSRANTSQCVYAISNNAVVYFDTASHMCPSKLIYNNLNWRIYLRQIGSWTQTYPYRAILKDRTVTVTKPHGK